jgi:hypothetical protein
MCFSESHVCVAPDSFGGGGTCVWGGVGKLKGHPPHTGRGKVGTRPPHSTRCTAGRCTLDSHKTVPYMRTAKLGTIKTNSL